MRMKKIKANLKLAAIILAAIIALLTPIIGTALYTGFFTKIL